MHDPMRTMPEFTIPNPGVTLGIPPNVDVGTLMGFSDTPGVVYNGVLLYPPPSPVPGGGAITMTWDQWIAPISVIFGFVAPSPPVVEDATVYTFGQVTLVDTQSGPQPFRLVGPGAPTPQPSSLALVGSGMLGLIRIIKRRQFVKGGSE